MTTTAATEGPSRDGSARLVAARIVRHAAVVGTAGLVTGLLVGGVGSRLLMRISALAAPDRVDGARTDAGL